MRHQAVQGRAGHQNEHYARVNRWSCWAQLRLNGEADESRRLEALFVLSLMPGLRPGELRNLTWDDVVLDQGIIRAWRSATKDR